MRPTHRDPQSTRTVVMVRPVRFGANPETLASNSFQSPAVPRDDFNQAAQREFDALAAALQAAGVQIQAFDDTPDPHTPDSLFPNNWFSTHADGTVVLYPLCAANRRAERRLELLDSLRAAGFICTRLVDLSAHELDGRFLEGTGSLVLDRARREAYACLSARTDARLLATWADELGYEVIAFHAQDAGGHAVYHTNVLMCIGTGFAIACLDAIRDPTERARVRERLVAGGRELVPISLDQLGSFAGNVLEVLSQDGSNVLAMSDRARATLEHAQLATLARHARIVASPIPTIEAAGGGSVRCMLAEVFLPRTEGRDA